MPSPGDELRRQLGQLVNQQFRGPVEQVRRKLAIWQDPRAKLIRKRKRALRSLTFRSSLAAITAGVAFFIGNDPGAVELSEIGFGSVAVLSAAGAASSGVRAIRLHRTPLPAAAPPPRPLLPPTDSMAREPMRRLSTAENSLDQLLQQLSAPYGALAPLSDDSVEHIRSTASEASVALRAVAEQLRAVELARDAAPPLDRGVLADEVRRLRDELDEGVDGYGQLVATAGKAVAATNPANATYALTEATDHLAGLAAALRELAGGNS